MKNANILLALICLPLLFLTSCMNATEDSGTDDTELTSPEESTPAQSETVVESSPQTQPQVEPKTITVYVTRSGEKYHRASCQYLRQSKIPIALNSAKSRYDPCSVCRPPR